MSHKVNLGNYESAEVFVAVVGITEDTTEEDIDERLDQAKIAFGKIVERIRRKTDFLRAEG